MPLLIYPATPYSKNLPDWVSHYFLVPTLWPSDNNTDHLFDNLYTSAFLITYGFDGYKHTTNTFVNTVSPNSIHYTGLTLDPLLAAASFIGLPTRTDLIDEAQVSISPAFSNPDTDDDAGEGAKLLQPEPKKSITTYTPKISYTQLFLKNSIGGWQWSDISTEKKAIQIIGLLIKVPVILPFKILSVFLKFPWNVIKLFTEFFPLIFSVYTLFALKWLAFKTNEYSTYKPTFKDNGRILPKLYPLAGLFLTLITILMAGLYLSTRLLYIIGRAASSPEKSASAALAYAQDLKLPYFSESTSKQIMFYVGLVFALFSLILSASLWAIALPLVFGSVVTYLPSIAQFAHSILQLPLIAALVSSLTGAFTAVGAGLSVLFGNLIAGTSAILGFHISATLLSAGLTLGAIVTLIASISSGIADKASDIWASWHKGGPVTYLIAYLSDSIENSEDKHYVPLSTSTGADNSREATPPPTQGVQNTVKSAIKGDEVAYQAVDAADSSSIRVNTDSPKVSEAIDTRAQNLDDPNYDPKTGELLAEL